MTVESIVVSYSSANDARNDFEAVLTNGGTIIERNDNMNADHQRAVKVFGDASQGASEIITLSGEQIRFVKAGALKYALRFETSSLKF